MENSSSHNFHGSHISGDRFQWLTDYTSPGGVPDPATLPEPAQGYYNHNYRIEHDGHPFLLRVPIPSAEIMDLRVIPESRVLVVLERAHFATPRLLYTHSGSTPWSLHEFVEGIRFHDLYPGRAPFPDWIPANLGGQLARLHGVDPSPLTPFMEGLPGSSTTHHLFRALLDHTRVLLARYHREFLPRFEALGIPEDPLEILGRQERLLEPRDFVLCHCDVHRKNLVITGTTNQPDLAILDWELALVADPLYEVAVHFHKMRYSPHQETLFLETFLEGHPILVDFNEAYARDQLECYLAHERVKSALVDTIRYARDFHKVPPDRRAFLADHLHKKLQLAWEVWRTSKSARVPSKRVYQILALKGDQESR